MKILNYPNRIVLELTPLCNLSCFMCPRHYVKDTDGFMEKSLWFKLIDEIAETAPNVIVLPFWRGESLLHPDFVELMEYALDKSLRIHISTNGLLVEGKNAEVLSRCEFVTFSIHTPTGYKKAKQFVHSLKDSDKKPTTQISFVSSEKTTKNMLQNIVSTSDLEGFDSVRLYEEHTVDGVFGQTKHSDQQNRIFCPKLIHTFVISYDGKVSRCNHIWVPEEEVNLHNVTIKEAWMADVMQKIRAGYPDQQCGPCDQWTGHTNGKVWRMDNGEIKHRVIGFKGETIS